MRAILVLIPALALISGCAIAPSPPDTYLVFFDTNSAALSLEGRQAVANAATAIRAQHPSHVVIASPKTVDGAGFNTKLADPRALAVEEALMAGGVSHSLLSRAALNDEEAVAGSSGNRRIEIRLHND